MNVLLIAPVIAIGLAACSSEPGSEIAQPEIVKTRQANLKSFGAAAKAIKEELDKASPSIEAMAPQVAKIATLAPEMPTWFPAGTSQGTEALPVIWEKPDEFAERAKGLATAAAKMQAAVDAKDVAALGAAFGETGQACKACHDTFRHKK